MSPWYGKTLRSIYDPTIQGHWFSTIDLCAILTDNDHKAARRYWTWFKEKFQLPSDTSQLKFEAPDGKYYFTEVVNFEDLIRIIQICPSPKANPYRLWLADVFFAGSTAKEIEKELAKLGAEAAEQIMVKYKDNPNEQYVRITTHKESYFDSD